MAVLIVVGLVCFIIGAGFAGVLGTRVKVSLESDLIKAKDELAVAKSKAARLEAAISADLAKVKKKL